MKKKVQRAKEVSGNLRGGYSKKDGIVREQGMINNFGPSELSLKGTIKKRGGGCNTRTSQEVTHPSTTLAKACLTVKF